MKVALLALLALLACWPATLHAAVGTQPPGSGSGVGGSATNAQSPSLVLSNLSAYGVTYALSNIIVVQAGPDPVANGVLMTNAVIEAGTLASATRHMLVKMTPGKYITPTFILPSVMTAVDNVSTYWEDGAEWGSGTAGSPDSAFMWDFTAGKRTNCNILGKGRFWLTNDGASCIIFENSSRMYVEALSFYATDTAGSSTANPFTWDASAIEATFDIKDYIEAPVYDAIYGDVAAGQSLRGRIQEIRSKGDLFEFSGDSPAWGLIDLEVGIGRQNVASGQDSFLQIGGRTKVRMSQIFVTSTVSRISSGASTTNGVLEGAVIQMPANGTVSPVSFLPPASGNSGYTLRNVTIYGPTNVDMCNITNTVSNPLTLENCTFYNGWAATNWARGATPSYVRILGNLNLVPSLPVGSQITIEGYGTANDLKLETLAMTPASTFLRGTNRWFDGGVSSDYTNRFVANSGGVTNILGTNLVVGSRTKLSFTIEPGVSVGFPGTTAAQWGGSLPFFSTNGSIWNIVEVTVPATGSTNYRHWFEGSLALAPGYKTEAVTNYATGTVTFQTTQRYTNYPTGALTINCATDVTANITNAVASNYAITLATPVIGTSGSLSLVSDGSARTLAILSPVAITWMSTNDTATATNILTTASKRSVFAWRVGMGTDGVSTNLHCWVKNQTP